MELLQHITLQTSGIGGKLTHDYLNGVSDVKGLYQFTPDLNGLEQAATERIKYPVNRKLLYQALHQQYANSLLSEKLKTNIELLLQENTFTITTGHQLNLFTGPLYFIYKIASVIALSKQLNDGISGKHFIPVYWMNSEDHDFAEINHFFLKGEKFEWKVELEKYGPVGKMQLNGIEPLMQEIKTKFGELYQQDPMFDLMVQTYSNSIDLADAHRTIVNRIFGDYGIVILDQDCLILKEAFSKNIKEEILNRSSIKNIESTNQYLEANQYKPQVFARDINFFYTGKGYRERIIDCEGGYSLADNTAKWTKSELEIELKSNPQFFSPNVVTRPMFQEFTLPNIAYVGGPAEIAYWLQYKTNFDAHHVFYPTLILRDCFLILPEKRLRKAKELGFTLEDFFQNLDELLNKYVKDHFSEDMDISPAYKVLNDQYAKLSEQVSKIDPSMDGMVKAAQQKALNDLERIVSKMNKALKSKNEVQLNIIKNLHSTIFPLGVLQERINNLFDQTFSTRDFVEDIISHANPLDARLKVLQD